MSRIPLLPDPLALLEKYERDAELRATGKLLPVPSSQKINAYLKEIAELCNMPKNLTTHLARLRSSARLWSAEFRSTCWRKFSGTNMTRHYAKFPEQLVGREMQKMNEQMFSEDVL